MPLDRSRQAIHAIAAHNQVKQSRRHSLPYVSSQMSNALTLGSTETSHERLLENEPSMSGNFLRRERIQRGRSPTRYSITVKIAKVERERSRVGRDQIRSRARQNNANRHSPTHRHFNDN
ncbi:hypothetical protein SAMN05518846_111100 [Brevibacillus centrosporus]|uniref:Uncharacterized protein n=1 Tax=Brevibacillus centrosporus TaxID=54910 RepID=A0A1I3YGF0_9BACL|nr:hypothetical protein SAMN05518846_111100 [Brevibacillus centrosporus]